MFRLLIIGTSLLTIINFTVAADIKPASTAPGSAYQARLRESPRTELPARVAGLVREAPPADRAAVAVAVTEAAVALAPAAAPAIVAAATREAPTAASQIAAAAVSQPMAQAGGAVRTSPAPAPQNPARLKPPFVPGAGTAGEVNREQPVIVQPGRGRHYAAP